MLKRKFGCPKEVWCPKEVYNTVGVETPTQKNERAALAGVADPQ